MADIDIAAPGGDTQALRTALRASVKSRRTRVVVIGDSLSEYTPGNAGSNLWWVWAQVLMGWPFDIAGVVADGGWQPDDVLANFSDITDLLADGPIDEAWVLIGENSINTQVDAENGLADFDTLIGRLVAEIGPLVIRVGTPNGRVSGQMSAGVQAGLLTYTRGLLDRARLGLIQLIDTGAAIRDTAQTDGRALNALLADDLHPNSIGAMRMGQCWKDACAGDFVPLHDFPVGGLDDFAVNALSRQILPNPMLTGASGVKGGSITGNVPTSWNLDEASDEVTGAVTYETDTRPRQRRWMKITFGGTATAPRVMSMLAATENIGSKGVTAGTTRIRVRVSIKGSSLPASFGYVSLLVQGYSADYQVNTLNFACLTDSGVTWGELPPETLELEVPATVVPVGTINLVCIVNIGWAAGGASGSLSMAEPQITIVE